MTSADVRSAESATGGQSHTQITVAVISAAATVLVAIFANFLPELLNSSKHKAGAGSPPGQHLSSKAQNLVETKHCLEEKLQEPRTQTVSITSPHPEDEVGTVPGDPGQPAALDDSVVPVEGTADLHSGETLYLFSYTELGCKYYFNPPEALRPTSDMHWTRPYGGAYLASSRGARVTLIALVADADTGKLFEEIIRAAGDQGDPFLRSLPENQRTARVTVKIRQG